jgi:hypothetical protein
VFAGWWLEQAYGLGGLIAGWRLRLIRPTEAEEKATGMERFDCRMAAVPYPAYEGRGKGYWDGAV